MAAQTTPDEIARWLDDFIDDSRMETVAICSKIGEDALGISRREHIYKTRTGNLQSSCGFAVAVDGRRAIGTDFAPMPGSASGKEGAQAGRQYLDECLGDGITEKGITLVMVAGMEYAGAVEQRGGDVLRSAEAHIRTEFDKLCRGAV